MTVEFHVTKLRRQSSYRHACGSTTEVDRHAKPAAQRACANNEVRYEDRSDRRQRAHRIEARERFASMAMRSWRLLPPRASTPSPARDWPALARRPSRRRRSELAFVRGRGCSGILRDVGSQSSRRGKGGRRGASHGAVGRRHRPSPRERLSSREDGQENLIKASEIPYTIVRSTQFFEFRAASHICNRTAGTVLCPPPLMQPIASDDVVSRVWPRRLRVTRQRHHRDRRSRAVPLRPRPQFLSDRQDPREVVPEVHSRYFGTELDDQSLIPADNARIAATTFRRMVAESSRPA